MQNDKPTVKRQKAPVNWKKVATHTAKHVGLPMLQGACFALGGVLIGKMASQQMQSSESGDASNVLSMKRSV